jgi:hypothetical protein
MCARLENKCASEVPPSRLGDFEVTITDKLFNCAQPETARKVRVKVDLGQPP